MALENNQIESSSIDNDEISLKELILKIKEWGVFLKSKLKIIFLAGFIGASIGLIIAYNSKTTYKATLTFALEEDKGGGNGSGLSGALGIASSLGIDLAGGGGGAFAASNLAELMKSRLLVERVLLNPVEVNGKTITLAEYYIQINNLRASWDKNPVLKNINYLPKSDPNKFS